MRRKQASDILLISLTRVRSRKHVAVLTPHHSLAEYNQKESHKMQHQSRPLCLSHRNNMNASNVSVAHASSSHVSRQASDDNVAPISSLSHHAQTLARFYSNQPISEKNASHIPTLTTSFRGCTSICFASSSRSLWLCVTQAPHPSPSPTTMADSEPPTPSAISLRYSVKLSFSLTGIQASFS